MKMEGHSHALKEDKRCSNLNWDTISNILSKLPTKSIARFRTVSKTWNSYLTATPYFINLHSDNLILHHKHDYAFISASDDDVNTELYLLENLTHLWKVSKIALAHNFQCPQLGLRETDTCNGLLCSYESDKLSRVTIQNPITGEVLALPAIPVDDGAQGFCARILFGFDAKAKSYKLMAICGSDKLSGAYYAITCGDSSWRELDLPIKNLDGNYAIQGSIFFNHAFYCVLTTYTTNQDDTHIIILEMDISSEKSRIINFPTEQVTSSEMNWYCLRKMGEKLALVFCDPVEDKRELLDLRVQCWILVDTNKRTWLQQSQMGKDILRLSCTGDGGSTLSILGSLEEDKLVVVVFRKDENRHELFLYDPTSGKQTSCFLSGDLPKPDCGVSFLPSLVSLNF